MPNLYEITTNDRGDKYAISKIMKMLSPDYISTTNMELVDGPNANVSKMNIYDTVMPATVGTLCILHQNDAPLWLALSLAMQYPHNDFIYIINSSTEYVLSSVRKWYKNLYIITNKHIISANTIII